MKRGYPEAIVRMLFKKIFINIDRGSLGGRRAVTRSWSQERLPVKSSAVNYLDTCNHDCRRDQSNLSIVFIFACWEEKDYYRVVFENSDLTAARFAPGAATVC